MISEVNKQVTTLILTAGTPTEVKFAESYPFYWINNMSNSDVYAAVNDIPESGVDGTYTIAAGSQLRISGGAYNSGVTLLGNGKVQVIASGIANCPFKSALGGGDTKYVNGIVPTNGNIVLTQSLIPSDGVAYQMPYYIQSGTVTSDGKTYQGINITFPKPFKGAPLLFFSAEFFKGNVNFPVAANYSNLTEKGFTLTAWGVASSGLYAGINGVAINWVALGVMEEGTDDQTDKN